MSERSTIYTYICIAKINTAAKFIVFTFFLDMAVIYHYSKVIRKGNLYSFSFICLLLSKNKYFEFFYYHHVYKKRSSNNNQNIMKEEFHVKDKVADRSSTFIEQKNIYNKIKNLMLVSCFWLLLVLSPSTDPYYSTDACSFMIMKTNGLFFVNKLLLFHSLRSVHKIPPKNILKIFDKSALIVNTNSID